MSERVAHNRLNIAGKVFGKWEVIEFSHIHAGKAYYKCKCKGCDREFTVQGTNLRMGRSTKCVECGKKEAGEKNKGVPFTEERKANISAAKKGKPMSEEQKEIRRGIRDDLCDQELLVIDPTRMENERGLRISKAINDKKQKAIKRGKEWNLTNLEVAKIITQPCHYSGHAPNPYNGIDRVDNTKGYTIDNVVPCCKACNSAKSDMTVEEFENWRKQFTAFNTKKEQI